MWTWNAEKSSIVDETKDLISYSNFNLFLGSNKTSRKIEAFNKKSEYNKKLFKQNQKPIKEKGIY